MVAFADRYYVTIDAPDVPSIHTVMVLVDAASPAITGGYGGWEIVDRPKRTAMTRWKGKPPFQQDIDVLFEGVADSVSQESAISTFERMAQPTGLMQQPPLITISGLSLKNELTWVIQDIKFSRENVIWGMQGGQRVRYRQPATVSLLEFVDDEVIITKASPAVVGRSSVGPPVPITVPQTTTLMDLAIKHYKDPSRWSMIWLANPFLVNDPRAVIPKGTVVIIPGKSLVPGLTEKIT